MPHTDKEVRPLPYIHTVNIGLGTPLQLHKVQTTNVQYEDGYSTNMCFLISKNVLTFPAQNEDIMGNK